MYAASTASTTSGSGIPKCSIKSSERRVRVVRLLRPRRTTPAFGFSLRGGREYSTGFFISKVELNSEAHHQGLKVGDQVISVNGYRVEDAVHAELTHYLASQSRLKIKVRNVGMIPVKEKGHEPLSWKFVTESASIGSDTSSSPTLCHNTQRMQDLRLSILVPHRAKLGCGICKGPEWKPGIFVQFVRENGIAREAGLRPGDQILACNGQDFTDITFNDAIVAMKAIGRLELVVREGAGAELVSPESSGYNSSASSAAGERSPAPPPPPAHAPLAVPAALRRKLASVAEEAAERVDRLTRLKRRTWDSLDFQRKNYYHNSNSQRGSVPLTMNRLKRRTWDSLDFEWKNIHNFDSPSDIEPDYDSPSIPNNPHTYENQMKDMTKKEFITNPSNRTIINLTEKGATIQCSYDNNSSPRKSTYSTSQYQAVNRDDKKTIVVEVHHTNCTQNGKTHCNSHITSKTKDFSDSSSVSSSTTLSNAIAEEILRRKLKKKIANAEVETESKPQKKNSVTKPPVNEKKMQHDALMDEFKKVHRKMFANQDILKLEDGSKMLKEDNSEAIDIDRQTTLPLRKPVHSTGPTTVDNTRIRKEVNDNPPPPPPMPVTNGSTINGNSKSTKYPVKAEIDILGTNHKNGTVKRIPTPDYNNKTIIAPAATIKGPSKDDAAELESLESYKLKDPSSVHPKPPSTYFVRAPNGTATMKKHARPVSVTIGEYSSGGGRKEPCKLEFLGNEKANGIDVTDDVSISNRLQSELTLTLSRSNLRKKTESLDKQIGDNKKPQQDVNDSYHSLDKHFRLRYGNNILPLPPSITIPKVTKIKCSAVPYESTTLKDSSEIEPKTEFEAMKQLVSSETNVPVDAGR